MTGTARTRFFANVQLSQDERLCSSGGGKVSLFKNSANNKGDVGIVTSL